MFGRSRVLLLVSLVLCFVLLFESTAFAAETSVATGSITHQHTDTSGSCYSTQTVSANCRVKSYYYSHISTWDCAECGNNQFLYEGMEHRHSSCGQSSSYYMYKTTCTVCGAHGNDSSPWNIDETHTYNTSGRVLTCTKGTGVVATLKMMKDVSTEGYKLSINPTLYSGVTVKSYAWSSGQTTSSIYVTSNGTYTCTVKINDGGVEKSTTLTYVVSDYDTESPVISGVTKGSDRINAEVVTVVATDNIGVTEYKLEN